jgi:hypothetical protein
LAGVTHLNAALWHSVCFSMGEAARFARAMRD